MAKQISAQMYQIKVTLEGVRPLVWRRLLVPSSISLRALHDILQVALGWTNSHLHSFSFGELNYGYPDPGGETDWIKDDARIKLNKALERPKDCMTYEYDFGDTWRHKIVLEKVEAVSGPAKSLRAKCTGGARACPPEDCGGVWGYAEFLKAIRNPRHPEHDEMLEWVGGEFDPARFDVAEVNLVLNN